MCAENNKCQVRLCVVYVTDVLRHESTCTKARSRHFHTLRSLRRAYRDDLMKRLSLSFNVNAVAFIK